MSNNTVKIKDIDYKVRYSIRAMFVWEEIAGKSFELKTLLDNYLFYYCIVLVSNPEQPLDWDDFVDELDKDPFIVSQIQAMLGAVNQIDKLIPEIDDPETGEKKN